MKRTNKYFIRFNVDGDRNGLSHVAHITIQGVTNENTGEEIYNTLIDHCISTLVQKKQRHQLSVQVLSLIDSYEEK